MNEQTKHTPGAWEPRLVESTVPGLGGLIIQAGNAALCEMTGTGEISQANARVMAAAPELLEFVKLIARMNYDGEEIEGEEEPFLMENDDAVSTLGDLIESARALINEKGVTR